MQEKVNITFIIPSLVAGGAQRIMSFLAKHLDKKTFCTTLLVIGYKKDVAYNIEGVRVKFLEQDRISRAAFKIIKHIKSQQPDIVVSSIVHLNTLMALISIFLRKPIFVAREASVLSVMKTYEPSHKIYFNKALVVFAYKTIDHLICQSRDMMNDMVKNYYVSPNKITLIGNPITQSFSVKPKKKINACLNVITVAWLTKVKGHDRIIEALSKVKIPFKYTIIGQGDQKGEILTKLKQYNLLEKTTFINYTQNIEDYLAANDVYLHGSYVEGLPNVVIESSLVGTPILAFKSPGGLKEVVQQGKNGYIVNSVEEYAQKLNDMYSLFPFQPQHVSQIVKDKFDKNKILAQYETLFLKLIQKN